MSTLKRRERQRFTVKILSGRRAAKKEKTAAGAQSGSIARRAAAPGKKIPRAGSPVEDAAGRFFYCISACICA